MVDCREGRGVVVDVSLLAGKLKVQLDSAPDGAPVIVERDAVRIVRERSGRSANKDRAENAGNNQ